ncbi:hypothetical protein PV387_04605 [Streptomyces sp. ME02-6987-2C]|uniref:hypothetical protein n=1 Tax=unclassified Streptomyces TaxID=2593676 RepID=UPI00087B712E|nr:MULTISPECIES: hypothetical protein [unclassified Streptomyces]MDX3365312.1 hypothetical protein [Streptomyces sp. ME02-6987-2C]MDX3422691.1 hypothetical protein [Streptomyces sp. ME02-6985-2c]REH20585.1 hypothetical protein BX268_2367 [Streptomyces sp. 2221.1]SDT29305.1 hypothetical protein SAMN05428941_2362 [Streptomyces sp. 2114.2]
MIVLNRRRIAAGALGLSVVVEALVGAPAVQAYDTATMKVSCSAAKFHRSPSKASTVVGIGYEGDKVRVDQFAYKVKEKTWYSRGTATRRWDGRRVRGYAIYYCVNPYEVSPPPACPMRP